MTPRKRTNRIRKAREMQQEVILNICNMYNQLGTHFSLEEQETNAVILSALCDTYNVLSKEMELLKELDITNSD